MTHAFFRPFVPGFRQCHPRYGRRAGYSQNGGLGKQCASPRSLSLPGCLAISGIPGFSGSFQKMPYLLMHLPTPYFVLSGRCSGNDDRFLHVPFVFSYFQWQFPWHRRTTSSPARKPCGKTNSLIILAILSIVAAM